MRPAPLRTDASNTFAHYSMAVRVPKILDEVIARNPDYAPAVHGAIARLRDDIRADAALPPLGFPAPDAAEWEADLAARAGQTWLSTDWFLAECYVYRCLMDAVRYWEDGRDPFAPAKREELASASLWHGLETVLGLERRDAGAHLHDLLACALWGNRVDLSYAVGVSFGAAGTSEDLLCDDRGRVVPTLLVPGQDVHVVVDNTGSELSMDLVLADALLTHAGARISLHVKMHPTFVSDAVVADVWALIAAMDDRGGAPGALAARLRGAWTDGRLRICPDPFWNGPRFLWDRPARFSSTLPTFRMPRALDAAALVVLKGDANYRRAVGDALWPPETGFAEVTRYFPAPLLALRALKSDAVVGLPPGMAARLDTVDRDWRINGRRGVIQLGGK